MISIPAAYRHHKNHKIYHTLHVAKYKEYGVWYDAIVYTDKDEVFVRLAADFEKKFILVGDQ